MQSLLAVGLRAHTPCAIALAPSCSQIDWAVVPSTRGRSQFSDMVTRLAKNPSSRVPVEYVGKSGVRVLDPSAWRGPASVSPHRQLLLLDDSWVSGAHAQSVASAMKMAGYDEVAILTVGRVLEPSYGANKTFIDGLGVPFDWRRCPWTGGDCPG